MEPSSVPFKCAVRVPAEGSVLGENVTEVMLGVAEPDIAISPWAAGTVCGVLLSAVVNCRCAVVEAGTILILATKPAMSAAVKSTEAAVAVCF